MNRYLRNVVITAFVLGLALGAVARKKKDEPPLATLSFLVLRAENGKPVRNAAVVLHPVDEDGSQERGGLELKTNLEGAASYDGVPYGTLRVQVLAHGFQTYGEDFEINQATQEITIKLKRPAKQYSIYVPHPKQQDNSAPVQKTPPPDDGKKPQN
jgi:hypothetical protein